jgi:hypothetical protein
MSKVTFSTIREIQTLTVPGAAHTGVTVLARIIRGPVIMAQSAPH